MAKINIIGSGGWGTANAVLLAKGGHKVLLWSYLDSESAELKKHRENKPFLPGVQIPEGVEFTSDISLCGKADLILPNMTEVSYKLGIDYVDSGYDENYVKDLLKKLCGLGAKIAAITGISFEPGQLGVMSYNSETGEYFKYFNKEANGKYHGTGDVFASCCTGALMNGLSTNEALSLAADYTARCIQNTLDDNDGRWYGVNFESEIPYLVKRLEEMR